MNNFLVLDESKLSDGSLYCFAGLLFKDVEQFFHCESEFIMLKNKYDASVNNETELKGNQIGSSLSKKKKELIQEMFTIIKEKIYRSNMLVVFVLMHKDDLNINKNTNVVNVVKKILETNTSIDNNEIHKYIYNELTALLVTGLSGLTFPNEYLQYILCDNIYSLDQLNNESILTQGNISITENAFSSVLAEIIEITHNQIGKRIHKGLKSIDFTDSRNFICIQVCDLLSNFIINSLRYSYYISVNNLKEASKYKLKYDLINNFLLPVNLPVNEIPLAINGSDITCNDKFPMRLGHL